MSDEISEKIASLLKDHVSKDWGMTNDMVNYIAMTLCSTLYKGLYMPKHLLRISMAGNILQRPFTMIINVGKHFVTVVCHKNYVLYLDPFGMPCLQPEVRRFLQGLRSKIFYNKTQIQQLKSKHCGLYAVLFALYYDVPSRELRLKFHKNASEKNDKLCTVYLHKLMNKATV